MSTKTLGWLVGARDGKKLGTLWDHANSIPTLSQPGLFQSFALYCKQVRRINMIGKTYPMYHRHTYILKRRQ